MNPEELQLFEAVKKGDLHKVNELLDTGVSANALYLKEEYNNNIDKAWRAKHEHKFDYFKADEQTPLHFAAEKGYLDIVDSLIKHGADVNAVDCCQYTPLSFAISNNELDVVECLLNNGANVDVRYILEQTPLHLAAKTGYLKIVDSLIKHGADINAVDCNQQTPLHLAIKNKHSCVVNLFIYYCLKEQKKEQINIKNFCSESMD